MGDELLFMCVVHLLFYNSVPQPLLILSYNDSCLTMANIATMLISFCLIALVVSNPQQSPSSIINANFTAPGGISQQMIINSQPQSDFTLISPQFDCSLSSLFTYWQSQTSLENDTPTDIVLTTNNNLNLTLQTKYNILQPSISPISCTPPGCNITITNHCQPPIHYLNYFDIFQLTITANDYKTTLAYFVYCKQSYSPNTLEWGLILQILLVTVTIAIVALYSNPWSLGGRGIQVNLLLLGIAMALFILGAIIGSFSYTGINVCLIILSFLLGIISVGICTNELLFLLRAKPLNKVLFTIMKFQFRIMEGISLMVGLAFTLGWFFSDRNIILNDIVSICMCVGLIKILKFTSLRMAGITFLVTISFQLIVVIIIYLQLGESYNNLFLNNYNYPVQLQFPTLNPTYNQKCAWLPVTAVIFPGMLLSYLRRFDSSRNTRVYLVTATSLFAVGGIAWVFVSIPSAVTIPFGLISEPCMFGLVCIFAYQRRQIRVIWSGEFYDEQFANQKELRIIMEMIDRPGDTDAEGSERRSTIDRKLIEDLKASSDKASSRISDENVVRSKFLKI